MREARLARPRHPAATADQRRDRGRVVRRAERRHANEPARPAASTPPTEWMRVTSSDASSCEQRQDPRQPAREHRLARAGRPGEQQVVPARGGDLERAARALLAAHVGEVGDGRQRLEVVRRRRRLGRVALAAEVRDRLGEMAHADRLDAGERDLRRPTRRRRRDA